MADGGDAPVIEPATGDELGRVGSASAADVAEASGRAAEIQPAWAATPFDERAAMLRKAGALIEEHAEEIHGWIIRETGGIPPKAGLETHIAVAGVLRGGRAGVARRTASCCRSQRTAPEPGAPRPRRRRRRHLAVQLPADPLDPVGGARRWRSATRSCSSPIRARRSPAASSWPGSSRRPGCPPACCRCCPAAPTSARRSSSDPDVRVISFTGSTAAGRKVGEAGGAPPQARPPRAGRQLGADRARRRRPRARGVGAARSARSCTRARSA